METQSDAFLTICYDLHRVPPSEKPKTQRLTLAGFSNCHRKLSNMIMKKDICIVMDSQHSLLSL